MFEKIKQYEDNSFYNVEIIEIEDAQKELGIIIPQTLKIFYQEIGYGFLHSDEENINRIMDPGSVCEFRTRTGQFANEPDVEGYECYEKDKLIFFEICESAYLSIGFTKSNSGKIFYRDKEIADSMEQFFEKYMKDENYFL